MLDPHFTHPTLNRLRRRTGIAPRSIGSYLAVTHHGSSMSCPSALYCIISRRSTSCHFIVDTTTLFCCILSLTSMSFGIILCAASYSLHCLTSLRIASHRIVSLDTAPPHVTSHYITTHYMHRSCHEHHTFVSVALDECIISYLGIPRYISFCRMLPHHVSLSLSLIILSVRCINLPTYPRTHLSVSLSAYGG